MGFRITERIPPHAHLLRCHLEVPPLLVVAGQTRPTHPLSALIPWPGLVAASPDLHDGDSVPRLPSALSPNRRRLRPTCARRARRVALRRQLHASGLPIVFHG